MNNFRNIENKFINESFSNNIGHEILLGENKIMLSAPHSVTQLRDDLEKRAEHRTGLIVLLLKELTQCHVIYKTHNLNDDANFDPESKYRNDLIKAIHENGIKVVLDFHISSPHRFYSVDLGTGYGKNLSGSQEILEIIKGEFENYYPQVLVDDTFSGSYRHTISSTISSTCNIPCIQIELNWNIISDYDKLNELISCLQGVINQLECYFEEMDHSNGM